MMQDALIANRFTLCANGCCRRIALERLAVSALLVLALSGCSPAHARTSNVLRVCADPNNLPYSNKSGEGFENKIAELLAKRMNARLEYTWWAQRRGFIRNTLNAQTCDVVIGVPSSFDLTAVSRPYYRSTYAFVTRHDRKLDIRSFDDPRLRSLRIGVQLVGDDGANTPPAHALAKRGITGNLTGYTVYGDYSSDAPQAKIIDDVVKEAIDVAIVWGPSAGFFARRQRERLDVVPVSPQIDLPYLPFVFDISVGVRRADARLRARVDSILEEERPRIDAILDEYGIPRVGSARARHSA